MAEQVIDKMTILLGLDPRGVVEGMNRASQTVKTGMDAIKGMIAPITGAIGFKQFFDQFIEHADALGTLADETGEAVENLHAWQSAAKSAGMSSDNLVGAIKSLSGQMQSVGYAYSSTAGMLRYMGISSYDAQGKLKKASDVLMEVAGRMKGMSTARAMHIGKALGLDDATIRQMQKGGKELQELLKRQKELGTYTKEDVEIARKMKVAREEMGHAIEMVAAIIMRTAVPAVQKITEKVTEFCMFLRRHAPFVEAFAGIIAVALVPALLKAALAIAPWLLLAAAIAAVAGVIDDLVVYTRGGDSLFEPFWKQFGTGAEVAAKLQNAWTTLKNLFNAIIDLDFEGVKSNAIQLADMVDTVITKFFEFVGLGKELQAVKDVMSGVADVANGIINLDFSQVGTGISKIWESVKTLLSSLSTAIEKFANFVGFGSEFEHIKSIFKAIGDTVDFVSKKVSELINWFKELFDFGGKLGETWNAAKNFLGVQREESAAGQEAGEDYAASRDIDDEFARLRAEARNAQGNAPVSLDKQVLMAKPSVAPTSSSPVQVAGATNTTNNKNISVNQNVTNNLQLSPEAAQSPDSYSRAVTDGMNKANTDVTQIMGGQDQ